MPSPMRGITAAVSLEQFFAKSSLPNYEYQAVRAGLLFTRYVEF